jgi:hypothetical protein
MMDNERRPAMRRGIPLSYLYEQLGEPALRESHRTDTSLVSVALWPHDWNESRVPCTGIKMVPRDMEEVPDDDWFVTPCTLHENLFLHFPEAPIGTPMW